MLLGGNLAEGFPFSGFGSDRLVTRVHHGSFVVTADDGRVDPYCRVVHFGHVSRVLTHTVQCHTNHSSQCWSEVFSFNVCLLLSICIHISLTFYKVV